MFPMQNLETTLAAALEALPTRKDRAGTIGSRLGISTAQTGLHTQRTRRRQFVDGQGESNAAAIVKRLPRAGEALHFVMDGTFTLANAIPVIQAHIAEPTGLTICTLGLNDQTTDMLVAMLKAGTLTRLRLAMSSYFRASDPATAARAITMLTEAGAVVAVERLHAKLQLWQPTTAQGRYVLTTSSNLRSCNCVQIGSITNDVGLYRWHNRWLSKFFKRNTIIK
jgi:hypothetical protein